MSNYKLFKKEGKLREEPRKRHIAELNYKKYIASLKEYIIISDDWKEFEEGAEVKEGEFKIEQQWFDDRSGGNWWPYFPVEAQFLKPNDKVREVAKPRPAKPSAKEKPQEEGDQENANGLKKAYDILCGEYAALKKGGSYKELAGYADAIWDLKVILKDDYGIEVPKLTT